jgi:beta-lactamase regulating signal transducer with metallopeptidase domain
MDELIRLPHDGWPRLLADFVWQSTLIGCLGWLAALALRGRPAARAHVCIIALALCIFVPVATLAVRTAGWGLLPAGTAAEWNAAYPMLEEPASDQRMLSALEAPSAVRLPDPWTELAWCIVRVVWYLIAAWFVLRLLMSVCSLARLLRSRTPCRAPLVNAAARVAAKQIGLRGRVEVAHGEAVTSPTVWTWGRGTTLILPPAACGRPHDWLSVFCHELAHARRGDPWSRLLAEVAVALLPWQPFVWVLRRHYQHASEEACDDWAVALGCEPDELADTLVNWLPASGGVSLAPSLRSKVIERVRRLLSMKALPRPELAASWRASSMLVAAVLACVLALAQARPPRAHFEPRDEAVLAGQTERTTGIASGETQQANARGGSRPGGRSWSARRFSPDRTTAHLRGCSHHILKLLALPEVRRDLRLSGSTYLALRRETAAALAELDEMVKTPPDRKSRPKWWEWLRAVGALNRELLARVESRLSATQVERLQQIVLQTYGGAALLDPRVAGRLAMTYQQREALRTIYAESHARLRDLYAQTEESGLPRDAAQACAAELRRERDQRLLGVLTPAQREAFDHLTGQKLNLDASRLYSSSAGETSG